MPDEARTAVLHDNAACILCRIFSSAKVDHDRRVVGRALALTGLRSTYAARTRSATASVVYTRSMRMPWSWGSRSPGSPSR